MAVQQHVTGLSLGDGTPHAAAAESRLDKADIEQGEQLPERRMVVMADPG